MCNFLKLVSFLLLCRQFIFFLSHTPWHPLTSVFYIFRLLTSWWIQNFLWPSAFHQKSLSLVFTLIQTIFYSPSIFLFPVSLSFFLGHYPIHPFKLVSMLYSFVKRPLCVVCSCNCGRCQYLPRNNKCKQQSTECLLLVSIAQSKLLY